MNTFLIRCSWHPLYNNGATLIMQDGDPQKVSDGCCSDCCNRVLAETAKLIEARRGGE